MTVKEFYEYCVAHGLENMTLKIQWRDGGGCYLGSDDVEVQYIDVDEARQEVAI